jgi:hypothetical protein
MSLAREGRRSSWIAATMVAVLAGLGPAGCAYVTAVPVKPGDRISGVRVYDVRPLLVVSGASTEIKLVPNYNRAYAMQFGAFLAKNNFQMFLKDGMITQLNADMNSTDFLTLLGKIVDKIPVGAGLSDQRTAGGVQDRFQVYDIVFDNDGNLVGLKPLIYTDELRSLKTTLVAPSPKVIQQDPGSGVNVGPVNG